MAFLSIIMIDIKFRCRVRDIDMHGGLRRTKPQKRNQSASFRGSRFDGETAAEHVIQKERCYRGVSGNEKKMG